LRLEEVAVETLKFIWLMMNKGRNELTAFMKVFIWTGYMFGLWCAGAIGTVVGIFKADWSFPFAGVIMGVLSVGLTPVSLIGYWRIKRTWQKTQRQQKAREAAAGMS
jgi:hypothetical protein